MPEYPICDQAHVLLTNAFTIQYLDVIDETHKHLKHKQFIPGKYHIKIIISANELSGIPLIQAHRKVYKALGDLMQTSIHAVSIQIQANP